MKILQKDLNLVDDYKTLNMDFVKVGDYLIFDIFMKSKGGYLILIEDGTVLTSTLMQKLQRQNALYIAKKDQYKQELNPHSLKYHVRYYQEDYIKILDFLYTINEEIFSNFLNSDDNIIKVEDVTQLIKAIIYLIHDNNRYLKNIMPSFKNSNELAVHSLHVAIYAVNLGNALHFTTNKLLRLGISALLHDVGIKKINSEIIDKEGELSLAELEKIHLHSQYSVEIMKHNQILDPYIIDAVIHHHESNDGSGYPHHLKEEEISNCASILAIVDVFDALTNNRPQRKAYNSFNALKLMMKDEKMAPKFNTAFVQLFLHTLE